MTEPAAKSYSSGYVRLVRQEQVASMASALVATKTVRFRTTDETPRTAADNSDTANGVGLATGGLRDVVYTSTLGDFPQIRFLRGTDNRKYAVIAGKLTRRPTDRRPAARKRGESLLRARQLTRGHAPVDPFAVVLDGSGHVEDDDRRHMFLRKYMRPLVEQRPGSSVVLENGERRRTIDVAPTDLTSAGRRRAKQTASTWFSGRHDTMTAIKVPAPPQTKNGAVTSYPVIGNPSARGRQQAIVNLPRANLPSPMVETPTRERFSATTPGSVEDQHGGNSTDAVKPHTDDVMTTENHDTWTHHVSTDDDRKGRHRKNAFDVRLLHKQSEAC